MMGDTRWELAKQIFSEALEKSGHERERYVAAACGADTGLRSQVEELLAAHTEAGGFLASPTGGHGEAVLSAAAAAIAAGPPEAPGARIGPYKLLQVIGEGGFGVVYMAEQEQPMRRRVALKIVKLGMDTKEVIARFEAERQALALMDHPNIARVFDAGATETGRPYFVMELVKGVPITQYCDENKLSTRERLDLFVDVCRAVHHAHEKGVIHRDIKPSNVLVTLHDGTPVPKVIDFGIAKAMNQPLTEKTLFTAYGEFIGTPWCMSPEQAAMSGLEIDRRADVYALGVLLYELLTGTTPFEAEAIRSRTFFEIMRIVREEDPPTPSARLSTLGKRLSDVASRRHTEPQSLRKQVSGDLDWIVMKAMEKDRRRRYDTAVDLGNDVARYFRHEPVVARRPSVGYRARKFARRRRAPLLAAAGILIAVVAGGAVAQLAGGTGRKGHSLKVLEPRLTHIFGSDSLVIQTPALSPDGRWAAFTTLAGESYGPLRVVAVEGGDPVQITDSSAREPAWFSTGDRIAFARGMGIMTAAFDSRSGLVSDPRLVTTEGVLRGFRLSPDDRWFAYLVWGDSGQMRIRLVPAEGGEARTLYTGAARVALMDWSADSRYLYFRAQRADQPEARPVFRIAVDGGEAEPLPAALSGPSAPRVPYQVVQVSDAPADGPPLEVQSYDGSPVARLALPEGAALEPAGRTFSGDGQKLLTVVSAAVSPVRVVSVDGRTTRQLGQARRGEWPIGWSPDSRHVYVATPLQGRHAIMRVSPAGGGAEEIGPMPDRGPPAPFPWWHTIALSQDGRSIAYARRKEGDSLLALLVRPLAGGNEREVTTALFQFGVLGRGGTRNVDGDDFLYLERQGDQVHLRSVTATGSPRLLRSFPLGDARGPKGVHGNRVAWAQRTAGAQAIYAANSPTGTVRELAALPGLLALDDVTWSHDGRWIAAIAYFGGSLEDYSYAMKILVVGVTPDGGVSVPARLVDTPLIWAAWGLRWLPGDSAVVLSGQSPPQGHFAVWQVDIHGGAAPVELTAGEREVRFAVLSPNGRHVAYNAHVDRGSSLWLADIGDGLESRRER